MTEGGQKEREAAFWDARSGLADLATEDDVLAHEPLFAFLEAEVRVARPRALLDAGCGAGVGTARLARYATRVVGIDVSPGSLGRAREWSRARGATAAAFVRSPLEALPFADRSFDLAVGYFVLHHLEDFERGAAELARVLRPRSRALFAESWGRNPLLTGGRAIADVLGLRQGTEDESPLRPAHIELLRGHFRAVRLHYPSLDFFKFAHQPLLKLRRSFPRSGVVGRAVDELWKPPIAADDWVYRHVPASRAWGWHVVVEMET